MPAKVLPMISHCSKNKDHSFLNHWLKRRGFRISLFLSAMKGIHSWSLKLALVVGLLERCYHNTIRYKTYFSNTKRIVISNYIGIGVKKDMILCFAQPRSASSHMWELKLKRLLGGQLTKLCQLKQENVGIQMKLRILQSWKNTQGRVASSNVC